LIIRAGGDPIILGRIDYDRSELKRLIT